MGVCTYRGTDVLDRDIVDTQNFQIVLNDENNGNRMEAKTMDKQEKASFTIGNVNNITVDIYKQENISPWNIQQKIRNRFIDFYSYSYSYRFLK